MIRDRAEEIVDIHVISIFPEMFSAITEHGVVARSIRAGLIKLHLHNPRDFTRDKHGTVDDRPYGGGPGMVMKPDVLARAVSYVCGQTVGDANVVFLSPQGAVFDHQTAERIAGIAQTSVGPANERSEHSATSLVLIAGRYEGIDQRFLDRYVDEEWSVGDYVLSGGELPAMIVIDAITRLLPDSLGNAESAEQDSFVDGLLDCPHYTRPETFDSDAVPSVLLSGDHGAISRWRLKQSLGRTWLRRPDLLEMKKLTAEQARLLEEFKFEHRQNQREK